MKALFALAVALLTTFPAWAVITALTPLKSLVADSDYVVLAKVEKFDAEKPSMLLTVTEDLKEKSPFRKIAVLLQPAPVAIKDKNVPQLEKADILKRLREDIPLVLLISQNGKKLNVYAYTNGTWMLCTGQVNEGAAVLKLAHGEPFLRRTYKGTTTEFEKVLRDTISGKASPPPNEKEPPGFGPELPAKQSLRRAPLFFPRAAHERKLDALNANGSIPRTDSILQREGMAAPASRPSFAPYHGRPFAVIPTVVVGGPFLILGMLFPAVFGGMFVLFRQWAAFLTVLSINSIIVLLHFFFAGKVFRNSWWVSDPGLWLVLSLVVFLGTMWAWRRQLLQFFQGADAVDSPDRTERVVLALLSATCAVAIGVTLWLQEWKLDVNTYLVLAIGVGIWLATAYKFVRRIYLTELPMTTEGVMLGGSLLVHLLVLGVFLMREGNVQGEVRQGSAVEPGVPKFLGEKWVMRTKPSGAFVSSPITWNGRVYAASAHPSFKFGTLYCLESADKSQVWKFDDEGDLKQVFSTPTIADGRLFIGEGFHDDANCKLYCVDLETGMKLWHFETTSQTEARPTVADGRVFMGCGNDGFFCIDAKTGKAVWQFPHRNAEGRLLRFGAGAAVSGSRVFVGTGVDRNQKDDKGETAVLCLDAAKGILLWKLPVDLPVWSEPVIADGQLFVALGNGDLVSDDPFQPAGRLLCLEPSDGRVLWRLDLPNSVLEAPSVDAHYVYVGSRDGNCYCVGRKSGKIRWRTPLGSPVLATPVLAANDFGETESVFAVASGGKACCLDPRTGAALWTYDVGNQGLHFDARPALIVENIPKGRLRRLVLPSGDLGGGQKATLLCIEDRIED